MRFSTVTVPVLLAALLGAGAASAAEGPKGPGDTGKGGGGPGSTGNASGGEASGGTGVESGGLRDNPDVANGITTAYKPWEVGVVFTTHRLIEPGDQYAGSPDFSASNLNADPSALGSNGVENAVNDYQIYMRYDITKNDRVGVKAFLYEYFLADQGENGVRFDDMLLSYTHTFKLPAKFRLQTGLGVTLPTSYASQLEGLITSIGPRVDIDRRFGPMSLSFGVHDTAYIEKYDSFAGSGGYAPTSLDTLSFVAEAEFHMPFHEPLSVGLDAFVGYLWFNNIQSGLTCTDGVCSGSGNSTKNSGGIVSDGEFPNEPIQQEYGWEAYVRYLLPDLFGFKSDLTFAYSFGDPTIGYSSLLQDGVGHLFLGYAHNSELYLSMAVRY
jgi:hypothetical protein